jgi:hypothetical protein
MAAMNMVSAGGFSGVSFHLGRCPQGFASVFCKKTPIFGSQRSKLDHLTVLYLALANNLLSEKQRDCTIVDPSFTVDGQILALQGLTSFFRTRTLSSLKTKTQTIDQI